MNILHKNIIDHLKRYPTISDNETIEVIISMLPDDTTNSIVEGIFNMKAIKFKFTSKCSRTFWVVIPEEDFPKDSIYSFKCPYCNKWYQTEVSIKDLREVYTWY